jgi:hypothetical protein
MNHQRIRGKLSGFFFSFNIHSDGASQDGVWFESEVNELTLFIPRLLRTYPKPCQLRASR